ncbi:unnamed protein product [Dicrocoelium dendriticum]|nr:unnamed protein product [Dicrocoelium dendriticum]
MVDTKADSSSDNDLNKSPTHNFHSPNNLLLPPSERGYRSGLLCTPVTRPPVNILFYLPRSVPLSLIVINPNLGRHKEVPSTSCLASAASILSCDNSSEKRCDQPPRVRVVLIRVTRLMDASCIPCIGAVELWSPAISMNISYEPFAQEKLVDEKDAASQDTSRDCDLEDGDGDASADAPNEFLDTLTGELMTDPIRLPSGIYVDRTSLHRFWSQRLAADDSTLQPLDPFTMTPLSDTDLKSDERLKQAISTYLDRRKRLNFLCKRLDKWPLLGVSMTEPCISNYATSSKKGDAL